MNRIQLIEWLEKYINMLPPHITVALTHSKPINKQETHILRHIYEYWDSYLKKL